MLPYQEVFLGNWVGVKTQLIYGFPVCSTHSRRVDMSRKAKDRLRELTLAARTLDHATLPSAFLTCLYILGMHGMVVLDNKDLRF